MISAVPIRTQPNEHCQIMFDLDKSGEDQLAGAMRRLPPGATLKLTGSGVAVTRVSGGRRFALSVPPKVLEPISVDMDGLKSTQTAPVVLMQAHRDVMSQLTPEDNE